MINKHQSIFLVGPMGAGKTTIGRSLARLLGCDFYDSDQVVEERAGVSVAWIFDVEGKEGFHKREREVLEELTKKRGIVLATGGGVVEDPKNCNILSARGIVVYLQATIEQQLVRMEKDKKRPLLMQTKNRDKLLVALEETRDPLYRSIADYIFSTDGRSVKAVSTDIVSSLKSPFMQEQDAEEE